MPWGAMYLVIADIDEPTACWNDSSLKLCVRITPVVFAVEMWMISAKQKKNQFSVLY